MNFNPPLKIKITSDNNVLTYLKTIPKTKSSELLFRYVFSESETKKNMEVSFTEKELDYQLKNFFKII